MGKRNKPTNNITQTFWNWIDPPIKNPLEFKTLILVILETRDWSKIFKGHPPTKDDSLKRGGGDQNSIWVQKLDQST